MNAYWKAVLAAAVPVVTAVGLWVNSGTFNAPELSVVIVGFLTAFTVAIGKNSASGILSFTKFLLAAITPLIAVLLQWIVTGSWDQVENVTLVTGLLTSVLVYLSANTKDRQELHNGSF